MVAIAVDPLRRNSGKIIERPGNAAGAGLSLHIAEAANVDPAVERARIASGRRDEIDCAAQRIGAETQGIPAFEHLDIAQGARVSFEDRSNEHRSELHTPM